MSEPKCLLSTPWEREKKSLFHFYFVWETLKISSNIHQCYSGIWSRIPRHQEGTVLTLHIIFLFIKLLSNSAAAFGFFLIFFFVSNQWMLSVEKGRANYINCHFKAVWRFELKSNLQFSIFIMCFFLEGDLIWEASTLEQKKKKKRLKLTCLQNLKKPME